MDEKKSESVARAATGRRGFIGGMLAAGAVPVIVPATVLGKDAPSNKITLGVIGLGARARNVVPSLVGLPNVRLVAMADCDLRRVRGGLPAAGDAETARRRMQISMDLKRLQQVNWNAVKEMVRNWMKGED